MKQHLFKLLPHDFEPIWTGKKRFDIIKDDRHFRIGDAILFREVDNTGVASGRYVKVNVCHKIRTGSPGLEYGYCGVGLTEGISGYDCTKESLEADAIA